MNASRTLPLVLLAFVACKDHSQVATASAATVSARGLGDSAVTVRRILVDSGEFMPWAASIDGRLVSGLDYKTGNVVVRDMRTGDRRTLTSGADWVKTNVEGEAPIISPNGKLVAYSWQNDAPSFDYELRVVGTDGMGERVLLKPNAVTVEEYPVGWTPDSRAILAVLFGRDNSTRLALVNAADGSVRVIRSFDWRSPGLAKFSPDGSWIAYDFQVDEQRTAREIILVRPSDGRETRLTNDGATKSIIGWSASGDGVFYQTTRGDAATIWYLPVRDGRAAGPARIVRADIWGAQVLGTTAGALYYKVSDVRQAIYDVMVDLDAGRAVAPATTMVSGTFTRGPAAWSPDGRKVVFVRLVDQQQFSLVIHNPTTGEERELPLPLQYGDVVKWSPDGGSVLLRARQRSRWGSYWVNLATGKAELLTPLSGREQLELSADGKTAYITRNAEPPRDSGAIVVKDLTTGAEREIYRGHQVYGPRLSPDERTLAFVREAADTTITCCSTFGAQRKGLQLAVMSADGGEARTLFTGGVGPLSVNWTSDGKRVVFAGPEAAGPQRKSHLSVVDVATGRVQKLLSSEQQTGGPRLSPDGHHITFWNTVGGKTSELWAMENLPGGPRR